MREEHDVEVCDAHFDEEGGGGEEEGDYDCHLVGISASFEWVWGRESYLHVQLENLFRSLWRHFRLMRSHFAMYDSYNALVSTNLFCGPTSTYQYSPLSPELVY